MTPEAYLGRVRALLPALRERAAQAEQLRRLPDETFADFQRAGLFRALQPKRYGGYELDPGVFYQAVSEVARSLRVERLGPWRARRPQLACRDPAAAGAGRCLGRGRQRPVVDLAGADRNRRPRPRRLSHQRPLVVFERLRLLPMGRARRRSPAGIARRAARSAGVPGAAPRLSDRRQLACDRAVRHRQQGHRRRRRVCARVPDPLLP